MNSENCSMKFLSDHRTFWKFLILWILPIVLELNCIFWPFPDHLFPVFLVQFHLDLFLRPLVQLVSNFHQHQLRLPFLKIKKILEIILSGSKLLFRLRYSFLLIESVFIYVWFCLFFRGKGIRIRKIRLFFCIQKWKYKHQHAMTYASFVFLLY